MMSKQPPKPLSAAGRVFMWVLFAFVLLLTLVVSVSLITEGVDGRRTLEEGPVGTFTPISKDSCEETCALIGEFTSADGTVVEQDWSVVKGGVALLVGLTIATVQLVMLRRHRSTARAR